MEDINAFVRKLNSLVSKLCAEDDSCKCDGIVDQLMLMLDKVHQMSEAALQKLPTEQELQFQSSSVSLWNVAVAKKMSGSVSDLFVAKLRHLACNISVASSLGNTNFAVLKRHLSMTSKAGSDWLECDNPEMADQCLNLALQMLHSLDFTSLSSEGLTKQQDMPEASWLQDLQRDAFKVYCCKAQVCVAQDEYEGANDWIKKAKNLVGALPQESDILAMLCFNFGFDALKRKQYAPCVDWFRESYELGKSNHEVEGSVLAKILRLLASAYLEWDPEQYAQKAINAVGLANAEHSHPAGLHLKVKINLLSKAAGSKLQAAVDELWAHSELNLDVATQTIRLLTKHNRLDIAVGACGKLSNRFQNKDDEGKLKVLQIEILLKSKDLPQVQHVLNDCLSAGSSTVNFDSSSLRTLHSLLWEQAAISYEADDFNTALVWYNFSYGIFTRYKEMENNNLARLQRNIVSCHLNLEQYEKAEEAVGDCLQYDPKNPYTHYLNFRVALCNNHPNQAIGAIKQLSDSRFENEADCSFEPLEDAVTGLISLAAQQAVEHTNQEIAIEALEKLTEHSRDEKQLITTYRCLIRLRCTAKKEGGMEGADAQKVFSYLKSACNLLTDIILPNAESPTLKKEETFNWFMKIAWNMALENSENCELSHKFFSLCAEFCSLQEQEAASLGRQKTCLVMAAAALLQTARDAIDLQEKAVLLEQVLQLVKACREVYSQLSVTESSSYSDRAMVLLNLSEFEALGKLGRTTEMELFAKQVTSNPTIDLKTIETLAALAMEPPCQYKALSERFLTVALIRHKETIPMNITRCSKILHSLIQLSLGDGNCNDAEKMEEAWHHFSDALSLIHNSTEQLDYPEIEILWLMTKSWNTGIYAYGTGKPQIAMKWSSLSMKFLSQLRDFKQSYEPKMQAMFEEVSTKLSDEESIVIKKEP